ncbi:MAG: hypothetical protein M5U26_07590 [Planctomycetota bacterium]|nr:hypothetical protein [Planctomycetota bacterium]
MNDHLKLDRAMSKQVAYFIDLMTKSKGHDDRPLLFHALAAYGSGVWGPNHWLRSLPVMLIGHAGGKIKQGLTRKYDDPTPMANLWLSMLQASGVTAGDLDPKAPAGEKNAPLKKFADSTGVLDGLLTA